MNKLKVYMIILSVIMITSCTGGKDKKGSETGLHKVVVKEVIQTSKYSYLKVKDEGAEVWLAVPLMEAREDETLYYASGFEMRNFESKELQRTFESILFVDRISSDPESFSMAGTANASGTESAPGTNEKPVSVTDPIAAPEGGISIAQVYDKKKDLNGKLVMVKGKVTKVNTGIMGTNWYHIEDGSASGKNKDLTVTSDEFLNLGDIATFEGKITLNKDIGSGYFFEVLMEKATLK